LTHINFLLYLSTQGIRESTYTEEMKQTLKAVECVHRICSNDVGSSSMQLTADFSLLYQCIRYL